MLFDSINLDVNIPAGDTQATVQLFSVVSEDPLGASLGWLGTGLSVPVTPPPLKPTVSVTLSGSTRTTTVARMLMKWVLRVSRSICGLVAAQLK
jgi:hypothetical protein